MNKEDQKRFYQSKNQENETVQKEVRRSKTRTRGGGRSREDLEQELAQGQKDVPSYSQFFNKYLSEPSPL
jgi:hypothetical protein